jgi:hypothetical protein
MVLAGIHQVLSSRVMPHRKGAAQTVRNLFAVFANEAQPSAAISSMVRTLAMLDDLPESEQIAKTRECCPAMTQVNFHSSKSDWQSDLPT